MISYLSSPCFSSRSLCCWWWWNEAIEAPCAKNGKLFSANPKADCRLAFNASLYIEGLGAKEGLLALKSRILLVSHREILEIVTWMERKDMRDTWELRKHADRIDFWEKANWSSKNCWNIWYKNVVGWPGCQLPTFFLQFLTFRHDFQRASKSFLENITW